MKTSSDTGTGVHASSTRRSARAHHRSRKTPFNHCAWRCRLEYASLDGRRHQDQNMPSAENVGRPCRDDRPPQKRAATKDRNMIELSTDAANRIHALLRSRLSESNAEQSSDYLTKRRHNSPAPSRRESKSASPAGDGARPQPGMELLVLNNSCDLDIVHPRDLSK